MSSIDLRKEKKKSKKGKGLEENYSPGNKKWSGVNTWRKKRFSDQKRKKSIFGGIFSNPNQRDVNVEDNPAQKDNRDIIREKYGNVECDLLFDSILDMFGVSGHHKKYLKIYLQQGASKNIMEDELLFLKMTSLKEKLDNKIEWMKTTVLPIIQIQSAIRSWNIRENIGFMGQSWNIYWQHLIISERQYFQQLQTVVDCYQVPLQKLINTYKGETPFFPIPVYELKSIFDDFEEILEVEEETLEKLEKNQSNLPVFWSIGNVFLHMCASNRLDVYPSYLKNLSQKVDKISKFRTESQEFEDFLKNAQAESGNFRHLSLTDLLRLPTGQIAKYESSMENLLRGVWKSMEEEEEVKSSSGHLDSTLEIESPTLKDRVLSAQGVESDTQIAEIKAKVNEEIILRRKKKSRTLAIDTIANSNSPSVTKSHNFKARSSKVAPKLIEKKTSVGELPSLHKKDFQKSKKRSEEKKLTPSSKRPEENLKGSRPRSKTIMDDKPPEYKRTNSDKLIDAEENNHKADDTIVSRKGDDSIIGKKHDDTSRSFEKISIGKLKEAKISESTPVLSVAHHNPIKSSHIDPEDHCPPNPPPPPPYIPQPPSKKKISTKKHKESPEDMKKSKRSASVGLKPELDKATPTKISTESHGKIEANEPEETDLSKKKIYSNRKSPSRTSKVKATQFSKRSKAEVPERPEKPAPDNLDYLINTASHRNTEPDIINIHSKHSTSTKDIDLKIKNRMSEQQRPAKSLEKKFHVQNKSSSETLADFIEEMSPTLLEEVATTREREEIHVVFPGTPLKYVPRSSRHDKINMRDNDVSRLMDNLKILWISYLKLSKLSVLLRETLSFDKSPLKEKLIGSDVEWIVADPNRRLQSEGNINLKKRDRKATDRYYYLFNDILVLTKVLVLKQKKYTIKQVIWFKNVEKISEQKNEGEGYVIEIVLKDLKNSINLITCKNDSKFCTEIKEAVDINGIRVFGVSLDILVKRNDTTDGIPAILRQTTDFLRQEKCRREGIFRINGNLSQINSLKEKYNQGVFEDLSQIDIHTVSNILKLFLRELPVPLVTYDLYQPLVDIAAQIDSEENLIQKLPEIKSLLDQLAPCYNKSLHFVCSFLKDISAYEEVTKMPVNNLAIVFASNIMRPAQSESMNFSHGKLETLMRIFINHVNELFNTQNDSPTDMEDENWMEALSKFCDQDKEETATLHLSKSKKNIPSPQIPQKQFEVVLSREESGNNEDIPEKTVPHLNLDQQNDSVLSVNWQLPLSKGKGSQSRSPTSTSPIHISHSVDSESESGSDH